MTGWLAGLPAPVLVIGGYGYRNVGDEAILAGLLAKIGEVPVTVVSRAPLETATLHGVRTVGINAAMAALPRHRSVLIGGGGLFGRDMGRVGRLLPAFGLLAAGSGREVIVDGVDVDPGMPPARRWLVARFLRAAERVTVRDRASVELLADWGVTAHAAPDLSSWMSAAAPREGRLLLEGAGVDTSRPLVGVSLTAVGPDAGADAVNALVAAMDALPDAEFCFIPMSRHPFVAAHDDLGIARRLAGARRRLHIVEEMAHPSVVLSAFGHLSAVVAMRHHAMLFAKRVGVPLVPIPYADKNVRWLAENHLQPVAARPEDLTMALRAALAADDRTVAAPLEAAS